MSYVRPEDRHRFGAAHAFVRRILGRYLDRAASCLEFDHNGAGKPFLLGLAQFHRVSFNLTHSSHYGLLAVTCGREIGVDIEVERQLENLHGLARQIMSFAEWKNFQLMPLAAAHDSFFSLWTQKEALLKAVGTGLLTDLREINLGLEKNEAITVSLGGAMWTIRSVSAYQATKAAIAVEGRACPRICFFSEKSHIL